MPRPCTMRICAAPSMRLTRRRITNKHFTKRAAPARDSPGSEVCPGISPRRARRAGAAPCWSPRGSSRPAPLRLCLVPRHDPRRPSERVGLRGTALRISSLHPNLVDSKSLVVYWREALLVQNVLRGLTRAYRNHPQLDGVRSYPDPVGAVCFHLHGLVDDTDQRGCRLNLDLVRLTVNSPRDVRLSMRSGGVAYERDLLLDKVTRRDPRLAASWSRGSHLRHRCMNCSMLCRAGWSPGRSSCPTSKVPPQGKER
ncbi:pyrimidine dimer DNA glycosylase/endonuclease V [Corynebacterium mastitidis]